MGERLPSSGRPIVTMMQPAESLVGKDATHSYGTNPAARCSFPEPEMRAVVVIVVDIISEQPFQMAFIQRNNVVQQVSPAIPYPTLCDSILPGTVKRGADGTHTQGLNRCENFRSI